MRTFTTEQIRNVALVGHGGAGKTSIAEAMLFASGATNRMGSVDEGNTHTDFEAEEQAHKHSSSLAIAPIAWADHKINVIDCPGYADFIGDTAGALTVAGCAVFVISAVDGVEVQHEVVWDMAREMNIPCIFVINKLDRERADFDRTYQQLRDSFGKQVVAVQMPIGKESQFHGIVDILEDHAVTYDHKNPEGKIVDIPEALLDEVKEHHTEVVEVAAEEDESLMEEYFDKGDLDEGQIARGIHLAVKNADIFPVFCTSATTLVGIDRLMTDIAKVCPTPLEKPGPDGTYGTHRECSPDEPMCAFVFKTVFDPFVGRISIFRVFSGEVLPDQIAKNSTNGSDEKLHSLFTISGSSHEPAPKIVCGDIGAVAKLDNTHTGDTLCHAPDIVLPAINYPEPVLPVAVAPRAHGEEEKLITSLQRLVEEDPVLKVERNSETHQTVLWAMGDSHQKVTFERLLRKFGLEIVTSPLRIPYRETLTGSADHQSRYIKQSGGRGQYAVAHIVVSPLSHGAGYEFENKVVGGSIPTNYIPSVDKGIQSALQDGVLAGYPVVDVKVSVTDGKFHPVDSSDMAFQLCAAQGFREAARSAGMGLLEPIMDVEVSTPDSMLGDVIGDLNSKRGRITGTEPGSRGRQTVLAQVPMAEMTRFGVDLRSITGGRATFTMRFSHYEIVPQHLAEKVIAEAKSG